MPLAIEEIGGSNLAMSGPSFTRRYRITGATGLVGVDAFDIVADFALSQIPGTLSTNTGLMYLADIQITENHYARSYDVSAPYSPFGVLKRGTGPGAYQISVDQTGGTVNVKAGRRIAGYGPENIDNGGLIGVEGEDVKGVDIPVEKSRFTIMFRHPQGMLTDAYIDKVGALVGFPASDDFINRTPGELMYLGGNFVKTNSEATGTYTFERSPHKQNFEVAGINIVDKKGWDVLSFCYGDNNANDKAERKVKCIEVIRPAGREWKPYKPAFGWG